MMYAALGPPCEERLKINERVGDVYPKRGNGRGRVVINK